MVIPPMVLILSSLFDGGPKCLPDTRMEEQEAREERTEQSTSRTQHDPGREIEEFLGHSNDCLPLKL